MLAPAQARFQRIRLQSRNAVPVSGWLATVCASAPSFASLLPMLFTIIFQLCSGCVLNASQPWLGNQPHFNLVRRVSALTAACRLCVSCTWLPKDIRHDAATGGFGSRLCKNANRCGSTSSYLRSRPLAAVLARCMVGGRAGWSECEDSSTSSRSAPVRRGAAGLM
jgi:hypothetical protein